MAEAKDLARRGHLHRSAGRSLFFLFVDLAKALYLDEICPQDAGHPNTLHSKSMEFN